MPKYLRKDFTYEYDGRGYMVFYKGQPIGGGGILNSAKGTTGRQVAPQRLEYKKYAETAIDNILAGNMGRIFREAIEEIDKVIQLTDQINLPCGRKLKGIANATELKLGGSVNMSTRECGGCSRFTPYDYKTHGFCTFK